MADEIDLTPDDESALDKVWQDRVKNKRKQVNDKNSREDQARDDQGRFAKDMHKRYQGE